MNITDEEKKKINTFIEEASDIGFDLMKKNQEINHKHLTIMLVHMFLSKCNSKQEEELLKTAVGVIIKDDIEEDMKREVMNEISEDYENFAYEKAKENGHIQ